MSFNIYKDSEEQFIYIEKNNNWYMACYECFVEDGDFSVIPIKPIKDISDLIKENINDYDALEDEEISKCSRCENKGYFYDDWSLEYEVCDCYHGQRSGESKLTNYLDDTDEDFYTHDEYLAWRNA